MDFVLPESGGTISRDGLQLDASKNQGDIQITMCASAPVAVELMAHYEGDSKPRSVGSATVKAGDQCVAVVLGSELPKGLVTGVQLVWQGESGTRIQVDSIAVE